MRLRGLRFAARKRAFALIGGKTVEARPVQVSGNPERVLGYLAKLAGPINGVIDVGASDGRWSEYARSYWPGARYLLIEAQDVHLPALERYTRSRPTVTFEHAAASDHVGELHFLSGNPWGGSASDRPFAHDDIVVPCVTVDHAVAKHDLPGPYLLKLDTHGHEREILAGAASVLDQAALVIVEAYNFANFGRMMFYELCAHMLERGFRPAGLMDAMTRPSDNLLWQMDIAFLPSTSRCFDDTDYGA